MISFRTLAVVSVCLAVLGACAGDETHKSTKDKDSGLNGDGMATGGSGGVGGTGGSAGQSGSGGTAGSAGGGTGGTSGGSGGAGAAGAAGMDASTDSSLDAPAEATPDADASPLVCRAPSTNDGGIVSGDAASDAGDAGTDAGDAASDAGDAASDAGDAGSDAGEAAAPDLGQWRNWSASACSECPAPMLDCTTGFDMAASRFDSATKILTLELLPGVADLVSGTAHLYWDGYDADGGFVGGQVQAPISIDQDTLSADFTGLVGDGVISVSNVYLDTLDACGTVGYVYTGGIPDPPPETGTTLSIHCEL